MNRRPNKKRYSSSRNNRKKQEPSSALSNQISAAIILCAFILIIAYTNSAATNELHTKMTAMISRNVVNEFEEKGNLKDNLVGIVKTVFSIEDDDKNSVKTTTEPAINNKGDEQSDQPDMPAADDGDSSLKTSPT